MSDQPPDWFLRLFMFFGNTLLALIGAAIVFSVERTLLGKDIESSLVASVVALAIAYGLTNSEPDA